MSEVQLWYKVPATILLYQNENGFNITYFFQEYRAAKIFHTEPLTATHLTATKKPQL